VIAVKIRRESCWSFHKYRSWW